MSTDRLKEAIAGGNLETVKNLVSNELINGDPYEYFSILRYAIEIEPKKQIESWYHPIVLHLIRSGRDVHFMLNRDVTLLVHALMCGSSHEVICELIKRGSDVNVVCEEGYTPLVYALRKNSDKKIVYELISNGADVNYRDHCGRTPLFSVGSKLKNPEIIKMFVNAGADIAEHYEDGSNILMLNICKCVAFVLGPCKLKEVVDICINKGVNLKDVDDNGNNILHRTSCTYLIDLARWYGVSLEKKNNLGQTALMKAVVEKDYVKIDCLLLRRANVNCIDNELNTPLHSVVTFRDFCSETAFQHLLYHGANLFACNRANETPLDIVCVWDRPCSRWVSLVEIVKFILLLDESKLKIIKGIYEKFSSDRNETKSLGDVIKNYRQELCKMKSTYIKDDLTFYQFCNLRKFYKNKCIDISHDEYKYEIHEINRMFPWYSGLINLRIRDNMRKKSALVLRKSFEKITVRPKQNAEFNFDCHLNYDCLYHVSRFLYRKELFNLISAAISDTLDI